MQETTSLNSSISSGSDCVFLVGSHKRNNAFSFSFDVVSINEELSSVSVVRSRLSASMSNISSLAPATWVVDTMCRPVIILTQE